MDLIPFLVAMWILSGMSGVLFWMVKREMVGAYE